MTSVAVPVVARHSPLNFSSPSSTSEDDTTTSSSSSYTDSPYPLKDITLPPDDYVTSPYSNHDSEPRYCTTETLSSTPQVATSPCTLDGTSGEETAFTQLLCKRPKEKKHITLNKVGRKQSKTMAAAKTLGTQRAESVKRPKRESCLSFDEPVSSQVFYPWHLLDDLSTSQPWMFYSMKLTVSSTHSRSSEPREYNFPPLALAYMDECVKIESYNRMALSQEGCGIKGENMEYRNGFLPFNGSNASIHHNERYGSHCFSRNEMAHCTYQRYRSIEPVGCQFYTTEREIMRHDSNFEGAIVCESTFNEDKFSSPMKGKGKGVPYLKSEGKRSPMKKSPNICHTSIKSKNAKKEKASALNEVYVARTPNENKGNGRHGSTKGDVFSINPTIKYKQPYLGAIDSFSYVDGYKRSGDDPFWYRNETAAGKEICDLYGYDRDASSQPSGLFEVESSLLENAAVCPPYQALGDPFGEPFCSVTQNRIGGCMNPLAQDNEISNQALIHNHEDYPAGNSYIRKKQNSVGFEKNKTFRCISKSTRKAGRGASPARIQTTEDAIRNASNGFARVPGVWYDSNRRLWRVMYINGDRRKTKGFSVRDSGYEEARRLAVAWKCEMMAKNKNELVAANRR